MPIALVLSFFFHASLLGWAFISFKATPPAKIPETRPVEVAIITPDELIRLRKGSRSSKKLETRPAKAAKKSKKKKNKKTPKRAVAAAPKPSVKVKKVKRIKVPPKPKSDEIAIKPSALQSPAKKSPGAKKRPQPTTVKKKVKAPQKEQVKRKANEQRKRQQSKKKKNNFDSNSVQALLNKLPDDAAPPSGSQDQLKKTNRLPKGPQAGAAEGKDTRLTASQRSMIGAMMKGAVRECWRVQTGMAGADNLIVEIEVKLNEDGTIIGEPKVQNPQSNAVFRDASLNAVRALKQCAPYADLPQNLYKGGWDHMIVTFDPREMF